MQRHPKRLLKAVASSHIDKLWQQIQLDSTQDQGAELVNGVSFKDNICFAAIYLNYLVRTAFLLVAPIAATTSGTASLTSVNYSLHKLRYSGSNCMLDLIHETAQHLFIKGSKLGWLLFIKETTIFRKAPMTPIKPCLSHLFYFRGEGGVFRLSCLCMCTINSSAHLRNVPQIPRKKQIRDTTLIFPGFTQHTPKASLPRPRASDAGQ